MDADPATLALALIESRRTLTLATAAPAPPGEPWAAPVYYLYRDGRFHFFSSPRSRHVADALASGRCAASIFRDGDDWREIEGLQMDGALEEIPVGPCALPVFADYVRRFPTVRTFFDSPGFDLEQFAAKFRSRLYAFTPSRVFYLNNAAGFGKRTEISLHR